MALSGVECSDCNKSLLESEFAMGKCPRCGFPTRVSEKLGFHQGLMLISHQVQYTVISKQYPMMIWDFIVDKLKTNWLSIAMVIFIVISLIVYITALT